MKKLSTVFAAMACGLLAQEVPAAEITVLSGGAIEPGLKAAAAAFTKETGHNVKITFNTTPQMRKRVSAGDVFDVVIAPPGAIKEFAASGKVEGSGLSVGRVGMGVAVRPGASVPDISNAEALKRSILDAESIVFNRASSGIYFENLLKKMGIYGQIEGKTTRYADGASVMKHVLKGRGREIGFGPVTEILLHKGDGLRYVGPLPAEVQNYTQYFAVPMTAASNKEAAKALAAFLGGPSGKALFVAAGIE